PVLRPRVVRSSVVAPFHRWPFLPPVATYSEMWLATHAVGLSTTSGRSVSADESTVLAPMQSSPAGTAHCTLRESCACNLPFSGSSRPASQIPRPYCEGGDALFGGDENHACSRCRRCKVIPGADVVRKDRGSRISVVCVQDVAAVQPPNGPGNHDRRLCIASGRSFLPAAAAWWQERRACQSQSQRKKAALASHEHVSPVEGGSASTF